MAPASVSAIVAALDLKLVRLLRAALKDDIKHGVHPLGPAPQNVLSRQRHEPEPVIEPRKHVHPTPYFEPRPVHHPEPRFAPREPLASPSDPLPKDDNHGRCKIQPPWKVRPWEAPMPMKREVKVIVVRPDIVSKGSLIDFFC